MTPLTPEVLQNLEKIAKSATKGPWFVARAPWARDETALYGNRNCIGGQWNDPHGARLIADFGVTDEWVEGEDDGRIEDRANADFCEAFHPLTALALLERIKELETLVSNIDLTLRVPAAEYVPAISDVFTLIDQFDKRKEAP